MTTQPTLEKIANVTSGKISRGGDAVIVGYGANGYLTLTPSYIVRNGEELPAVEIRGRLARRDGGLQAELRSTLRAAGIEVC